MRIVRIDVTTNGSGDGNATQTPRAGEYGYLLHAVEWIDGDFADGVGATLDCVNTHSGVDRTILTLTAANIDALYYPRILEHDNAGTPLSTYTLPLIDGDLKLTVASGGSIKTGGAVVYLLEA